MTSFNKILLFVLIFSCSCVTISKTKQSSAKKAAKRLPQANKESGLSKGFAAEEIWKEFSSCAASQKLSDKDEALLEKFPDSDLPVELFEAILLLKDYIEHNCGDILEKKVPTYSGEPDKITKRLIIARAFRLIDDLDKRDLFFPQFYTVHPEVTHHPFSNEVWKAFDFQPPKEGDNDLGYVILQKIERTNYKNDLAKTHVLKCVEFEFRPGSGERGADFYANGQPFHITEVEEVKISFLKRFFSDCP